MRKKQPLIIALIFLFTLVVCVGVLILNWSPQEASKQSDQVASTQSNHPLSETQLNQENNEKTSVNQDVITKPVVPQIPNTNSESKEKELIPEQNQNEQSKQEDLLDLIERSIKETLSKASLIPSKS